MTMETCQRGIRMFRLQLQIMVLQKNNKWVCVKEFFEIKVGIRCEVLKKRKKRTRSLRVKCHLHVVAPGVACVATVICHNV